MAETKDSCKKKMMNGFIRFIGDIVRMSVGFDRGWAPMKRLGDNRSNAAVYCILVDTPGALSDNIYFLNLRYSFGFLEAPCLFFLY